MLTRRDTLLLALAALPVGAAPAKEFWDEKKPEDWTAGEIEQLLTKSPWAKEASISFNGGPGGPLRYGRMRPGTSIDPATVGGGGNPKYGAIVRWESAQPIRDATKSKPAEGAASYYIIAVAGDDLPNIMRSNSGDEDDENQRRTQLEALKQFSRIEKKGDFIALANADAMPKAAKPGATGGTLFYFPRADPIKPDDRQVTFVTKMGPIEVKAKFTVKEMMYHGKLEL